MNVVHTFLWESPTKLKEKNDAPYKLPNNNYFLITGS